MYKFLHIGFAFFGLPKVQELEPLFAAVGDDWVRYAPNNWIIWTQKSAQEVSLILKPVLTPADQLLVVELDLRNRGGWLAQWLWHWIDGKSQSTNFLLGQVPYKPFGDNPKV